MKKPLISLLAAVVALNAASVSSSGCSTDFQAAIFANAADASSAPSKASNYIISRGVPAYSGSNSNASFANDDFYYTSWNGSVNDYIAYDFSSVPESQRKKVLAVWYTLGTYDNIGEWWRKVFW